MHMKKVVVLFTCGFAVAGFTPADQRNFYNVLFLGAIGDGVADDATAI